MHSGRIDTEQFEVKKRQPHKVGQSRPNEFFVKKSTNIAAQSKKVQDLLLNGENEVVLYGLGASLNRALVLLMNVIKLFNGTLTYAITTGTVQVTDDLFPLSDEHDSGERSRPLSLIRIAVSHLTAS